MFHFDEVSTIFLVYFLPDTARPIKIVFILVNLALRNFFFLMTKTSAAKIISKYTNSFGFGGIEWNVVLYLFFLFHRFRGPAVKLYTLCFWKELQYYDLPYFSLHQKFAKNFIITQQHTVLYVDRVELRYRFVPTSILRNRTRATVFCWG